MHVSALDNGSRAAESVACRCRGGGHVGGRALEVSTMLCAKIFLEISGDGARRLGRGCSMSSSRHVSGMALCVRHPRFPTPPSVIAGVSDKFCLDS